jgi:predicted AlkP superfamily pyrophosphatase or phosphodiesterase
MTSSWKSQKLNQSIPPLFHIESLMNYRIPVAFAVLALVSAVPCLHADDAAKSDVRKCVLLIGIDGCRGDAIPAATVAHTLHGLIKDGAFAMKCDVLGDRVTGVPTLTGPGWCSLLSGVWADKHLAKDNDLRDTKLDKYPNFFRRLREAKPEVKTAAFVTWKPFAEVVFNAADGRQFVFDGDTKGYQEADRVVTKSAVEQLAKGDIDAAFVYFGEVDSIGHGYGFHPKSPRYTAGIEVIDKQIEQILTAVRSRPNYAKEDWLVMIATDHGGKRREHGLGEKEPEIRTGFLLLHGPSVKRGTIDERIFNVDIPVTALTHMGVAVRPEWGLDGKVVGLQPR